MAKRIHSGSSPNRMSKYASQPLRTAENKQRREARRIAGFATPERREQIRARKKASREV